MPRDLRSLWNRRTLLRASLAAGAGCIATGLYTWQWEPHWVEVVSRDLPIAQLPAHLEGKTLVHLTDLHISERVDNTFLSKWFAECQSWQPEIVVITGDFTSYETDLEQRAAAMFPKLPRGSMATLGVLGNHDYGLNFKDREHANRLVALAHEAGITMLRNSVCDLDGFQVLGLEDLWSGAMDIPLGMALLSRGVPSLVLAHNPDSADRIGWDDYAGWILSGHTHGGQCKPPFLPPPLLPVKNRRYTSGQFALSGGRQLYINRGLGHLLQVRFNCRPEVTRFTLRRA
jgi:predicted MPP superfamily phosphohydrolase